jgi:hypothetical protein
MGPSASMIAEENKSLTLVYHLNLGCLHPVACVRSGVGGFLSVYATSLS